MKKILPVLLGVLFVASTMGCGNIAKAKIQANESEASAHVKTIATAIEVYAANNNGEYPSDESVLTGGQQPYIDKSYNNKIINGYQYFVELGTKEYRVIAKPISCGSTGTKNFGVINGGNLIEEECK